MEGAPVSRSRGIFPALLLTLLMAALQQGAAATLTGRITDRATGEPVGFAVATIRSLGLGGTADPAGNYRINDIPVGTHTVEFTRVGYKPDTTRVTVTSADETIRLDAALTVSVRQGTEMVVTGSRSPETDAAARQTEQNSPTVMNVLSAEAIQRSPDASVAEAVKRIPGVAIDRVRGEARQAIIRGMAGRYNSALVDGVKIPSPLENSRSINLDFIPSDLLERIEVTKVATPDQEGDAIGGVMNFIMRSAPNEPFIRARVGTGYGTMLAANDFIGFRSDSVLDDPLERFGRGYRTSPSDFPLDNTKAFSSTAPPDATIEFTAGTRTLENRLGLLVGASMRQNYQLSEVLRNYEAIDADNETYFVHSEWRVHSHSKTKYGLNLKTDYVLDPDNSIAASFTGMFRHNREYRFLSDTGAIYFPTLATVERTVFQRHSILSANLNGRHHFDEFDLRWTGGWSLAQQYKPDRTQITATNVLEGDSVVSERYFQTMDRDWQRNRDRDYFGRADLAWTGPADQGVRISTGTLVRFKYRDNYMNFYRFIPIVDSVTGELSPYTGIDDLRFKVLNAGGTPEYSNNNYTASESIAEGYLQGEWTNGPWHILAGSRIELTDGEYSTYDATRREQIHAEKHYMDILPSVHFRYALTGFSNLRLSLGQSLSRPDYFEMVPYNYVGGDSRRQGNPNLRRSRSTNIDLRYELYQTPENPWEFAAGVYFKNIQDPIETMLDLSNPSLPTQIPMNLGRAINYGFEFAGSRELLTGFTVAGNYTFTLSSITSDKIRFNHLTETTERVSETRGLEGQSRHVGNLSARYKLSETGTMIQASTVFTGRRVVQVSPYLGHDYIQTNYLTLDLSAEQRLGYGFTLFAQATNLLDTPYEIRIENGELIESEKTGRQFMIGITFKTPDDAP